MHCRSHAAGSSSRYDSADIEVAQVLSARSSYSASACQSPDVEYEEDFSDNNNSDDDDEEDDEWRCV